MIRTENSTYELEGGMIRCLKGREHHPIKSTWHACIFFSYPKEGEQFVFANDLGLCKTSVVLSIDDDEEKFGWTIDC